MARWLLIIALIIALPVGQAHIGSVHSFFNVPDVQDTGEVFLFNLVVGNASARAISIGLAEGDPLLLGGTENSEYAVSVYADQKLLYEIPLKVDLIFHGETVDKDGNLEGYTVNRTEVEFYFRLPAIVGATNIVVLKQEKVLLDIDVTQFCTASIECGKWKNAQSCPLQCSNQSINPVTQCGNGVCDNSETYRTCPQDCKSGGADKLCDRVKDGICDPDCSPGLDADCAAAPVVDTPSKEDNQKAPVWIWFALFGVAMLLILGVVMFLNRKQPPAQQQDFGKYQQQYQQYQQQKNYRR